jgi:hypothetical protein
METQGVFAALNMFGVAMIAFVTGVGGGTFAIRAAAIAFNIPSPKFGRPRRNGL